VEPIEGKHHTEGKDHKANANQIKHQEIFKECFAHAVECVVEGAGEHAEIDGEEGNGQDHHALHSGYGGVVLPTPRQQQDQIVGEVDKAE